MRKSVVRSCVVALAWTPVVLAWGAVACGRVEPAPSRGAPSAAPTPTPAPSASTSRPTPGAASDRPDILLVSIDTLRADHVSANGYRVPTTPLLEALARDGMRFSHAYSTSSWTVPALASLLTSTYPERHQMDENRRRGGRVAVLPEALATLPEVLRRAGYTTFGITANYGLLDKQGFGRGFDRFVSPGPIGAEDVEPLLRPWLGAIGAAKPWFVWLHLFDPHASYLAREPWLTRLWPAARPRHANLDGARLPLQPVLTPDEADYMRALYDSEIRHVDERLRAMLAEIPRSDRALVVFTADHGEEFLERGSVGHGRTLFDECIRVPLVVRLPDRRHAGRVVDAPVSLVDVMPTVLAAAGLPALANAAGISLVDPDRLPADRTLFARLVSSTSVRGAIDRRFKLVLDIADPTRGQLYDLASDPGEKQDAAATHPDAAARLMRAIEEHVLAASDGRQAPTLTRITPTQEEQVRALGYTE